MLPLSRAHLEVLDRAVASGHGDEDNSVVLQVLRELSGDAAPPESGGG